MDAVAFRANAAKHNACFATKATAILDCKPLMLLGGITAQKVTLTQKFRPIPLAWQKE